MSWTLTKAANHIGIEPIVLQMAANRGMLDTYQLPRIKQKRVTLAALQEFAILFGYRMPEVV